MEKRKRRERAGRLIDILQGFGRLVPRLGCWVEGSWAFLQGRPCAWRIWHAQDSYPIWSQAF